MSSSCSTRNRLDKKTNRELVGFRASTSRYSTNLLFHGATMDSSTVVCLRPKRKSSIRPEEAPEKSIDCTLCLALRVNIHECLTTKSWLRASIVEPNTSTSGLTITLA